FRLGGYSERSRNGIVRIAALGHFRDRLRRSGGRLMAGPSNRSRIDEALGIVASALDPYIAGVVAPHVPAGQDWTVLQRVRDEADGYTGKQYSRLDLQLQLKRLTQRYGGLGFLFNGHLSRAEQTFAKELGDLRNDLAHNNAKAYSAD